MESLSTFPINPSNYKLDDAEVMFFKTLTGIQDDDELRNHILRVQREVYAIKISKYPAYKSILKLGKERKGALFLDLGCCFGNDARKAIFDGFPLENVIASDLHPDDVILGLTSSHVVLIAQQNFGTSEISCSNSPVTFPVCFLPGDIFDPSFLSPNASPAPPSSVPDPDPTPSLSKLTSLTPLLHHVSIIHAGSFFYLFKETQHRDLAYLLATLLSPLPGSMIVGSHIGLPDTEEYTVTGGWLLRLVDI